MATMIDAKYSTLIGTPAQIMELFRMVSGAGMVDLKFSNVVILAEPVTEDQFRTALTATPADGGRSS